MSYGSLAPDAVTRFRNKTHEPCSLFCLQKSRKDSEDKLSILYINQTLSLLGAGSVKAIEECKKGPVYKWHGLMSKPTKRHKLFHSNV